LYYFCVLLYVLFFSSTVVFLNCLSFASSIFFLLCVFFGFSPLIIIPSSEDLDMLCLLPKKGREVDLFLEPAFVGDGHDQRQQVAGHSLLTGLKQGESAEQEVVLGVVKAGPIGSIGREVERLGVPGAELLGLLGQTHGDR